MKNRFWLLAACLFLLMNAPRARAEDPDPFMAPPDKAATSPTAPPSDTPAPSLGSDTPANIAKPNPEEQQPLPLNSIPGKTETSPMKDPEKASKKDIYDEYYDYLNSDKERQDSDKDISMRSYFPHENGAFQLGLMYSFTAFSGYNFNFKPGTVLGSQPSYAKTQGGNLFLTWFPVKSLTVGRLGFGINGGIFWSKFNTQTGFASGGSSPIYTVAKPQNIVTYGARATYEFDYWLAQIIVPFAYVGADEVAIQAYSVSAGGTTFLDIPRRQLVSQYWGGGVHFYLNRVEPVVGSRALVNVGIRKFYLTYMIMQRGGELDGITHSLGLNFEF